MPRYTIIESPTFIGNTLRPVGEVVDYDGWPGSTLQPADAVAERIKAHYDAARKRGKRAGFGPCNIAEFADKPEKPAKAPKED